MKTAWRYLRVVLILVLELVAVGLAAGYAARPFAGASGLVAAIGGPVASVVAAVGVYLVLVRFVERRPATELGLRHAIWELPFGLLVGAMLFTLTIGVIILAGGYRILSAGSLWLLVPPLGMALVSGVVEELMVRGILFRLLEDLIGSWGALCFSAALFGLAHITNPHATWFGALAIAIEAGTLLGAAYMATRRLWFAIGIHAAWNWTQGAVFGVAVSGHAMQGFLSSMPRGPEWLSGGDFGVEASVVAMLACGTAALLILRAALKLRPVVAPAWSPSRRAREGGVSYPTQR